jgi:general secretion pathway protein E
MPDPTSAPERHDAGLGALPLPQELSADYLEFNRVLPLGVESDRVRVACVGAPAEHVIEDLQQLYGLPVEIVPVTEDALQDGIRRATAAAESVVELVRDLEGVARPGALADEHDQADVRDLANQPPVIRFVSLLIREAHAAGASDVHLDASRGGLRIRFRVDGVLGEVPAPPADLHAAVVSRIKLLAELDIAERRLPQDGRIRMRLASRALDLRIATVPTPFGESVTIRLLDRGGRPVALADLGMGPETLAACEALAQRRHGVVLVTGPTGSGKTTTLYAALGLRDHTAEKIITVEDPVEYELPGVTQIAVDEQRGLTFARALRAMVRLDPNVLMVGEIRDEESADIAVRAAMTGHLVFTTLHTNDAVGAVFRLLDLGVPSYLVSASVEGILAQRLVRRSCPDCRTRYRPDPQAVALLAERPVGNLRLERGAGCPACRQTGYRGRTGLFELLRFEEDLKEAVARSADRAALNALAARQGMQTLKQDGWAKVQAGITTVEEVLRVVQT